MAENERLKDYRHKRDFRRTSEPEGGRGQSSRRPIFVVQKHDAKRLHYDFRLEVGGVLKSWAVPKGPSLDPRDKRLAVPTEDHPMAYAGFEGVIPEGEYGAGTVLVWDAGTYRNLRKESERKPLSMEESLADGKLEIWLQGRKLQGGYALVRTRIGGEDDWLLIKERDEWAEEGRDITAVAPGSVLSGKTLEEIAKG